MTRHHFTLGDTPFRILQLTDLHIGGVDKANAKDEATRHLIDTLIREQTPDLIIATGDSVNGSENLPAWHALLDQLEATGIPYTFTFGNHDSEHGTDRRTLLDTAAARPNCLMRSETAAGGQTLPGEGNHLIELRDADGTLCWLLALIDSGDHSAGPTGGYAAVDPAIIDWLEASMREAADGAHPDYGTLLFLHIPPPEVVELHLRCPVYGRFEERCCPPRTNSGLFHRLRATEHLRGMFYGHDHVNDFEGTLHDVRLVYGRASGYNTYGHAEFSRGGRLITVTAETRTAFETNVCLPGGEVLGRGHVHHPLINL